MRVRHRAFVSCAVAARKRAATAANRSSDLAGSPLNRDQTPLLAPAFLQSIITSPAYVKNPARRYDEDAWLPKLVLAL